MAPGDTTVGRRPTPERHEPMPGSGIRAHCRVAEVPEDPHQGTSNCRSASHRSFGRTACTSVRATETTDGSSGGTLGPLTLGACWQFFEWCAVHGLELTTVRPFHVAAWIEDFPGSKPTIKLKLAAVRMLYDFLVVRQITRSNPAHSVRGPKYVVKKGKTPVWSREDAKTLLDSIPKDSVSGLRDLALIAAMFYSFARVSAVLKELVSYCAS
jgi:hypothetical protein